MQTDLSPPTIRITNHRYDIYGPIHKGLRAFMQDTLYRVGCVDTTDARALGATLEQLRSLLDTCEGHLEHENRFVHPALEARRPGGSARTADDHVGHERAIGELRARAEDVEHAADYGETAVVERLVQALYLALSQFVAENYEHMHYEETENGRLLWAHYTDDELRDLEQTIIAAATPEQLATNLRWMLPALTPSERRAKGR
jgi:iron-sulfur cluster repair protein YtfE (RIC family)